MAQKIDKNLMVNTEIRYWVVRCQAAALCDSGSVDLEVHLNKGS